MRLAHLLRLIPLAAAALASVATSALRTPLEIEASTPVFEETAVPGGATISVRVRKLDDSGDTMPTSIAVRSRSTHADVAGATSSRVESNGDSVYTFTPATALPADTYAVSFVGATDYLVTFANPDLDKVHSLYTGTDDEDAILLFSTLPEPTIRYVRLEPGNVYVASFTTDMDVGSLANVDVVDVNGNALEVSRVWRGGDLHELELDVVGAGANVRVVDGVLSAAGVAAQPVLIGP